MFFDPYDSYNSRLAVAVSYARIFHAVPNAPAVDVYLNNKIITRNLGFGNFTEYLSVQPGYYETELYRAGSRNDLLVKENIFINPSSIYTIAATNYPAKINLLQILEPKGPFIPGKFFIRFGHLSPNSPNVDLTLANGKKLFTNVPYKKITGYIPLSSGTYNFRINSSETGELVLNVPNINLRGDRFYTIYAIGLLGDRPPLHVVIPLDGNSYLNL